MSLTLESSRPVCDADLIDHTEPIEALFAMPAALPTIPKLVQQLIASFSRDDVSMDQIARPLAADPVLGAKTLRLANSAYFHVSRKIATIDDALRMLGFVMVRNLVVGSAMATAFKAVKGLDLNAFWRHSLNAASAARWMAQRTGLNSDLAFTGGLMHGLGHLVLHSARPASMLELNRQCPVLDPDRAVAERHWVGYHHGEVTAELARRWKFPEELSEPLAAVPFPLQPRERDPLAGLLHLAVWRARADKPTDTPDPLPTAVLVSLGLQAEWDAGAKRFSLARLGAELETMPALAELSQGLDGMLG